VRLFPAAIARQKKSQTLTLEKAAPKLFSNFGKKTCETKPALPYRLASHGPFFATRLKVPARHLQWGEARARGHVRAVNCLHFALGFTQFFCWSSAFGSPVVGLLHFFVDLPRGVIILFGFVLGGEQNKTT
jgi:hypothetical protein